VNPELLFIAFRARFICRWFVCPWCTCSSECAV